MAASATAVICGTPTPVTTRVVQMLPGPMPTFTASTPASNSALAPSPVPTLPPMTATSGCFCLIQLMRSSTLREWPWAVSTTNMSTPASTSASTRSSVSSPVPTLAPTRSCPSASLQALGNACALAMSFTVTMPFKAKCSSTSSTFSMRCSCSSSVTASSEASSAAVTKRSLGVITSATVASRRFSKRMSRCVTMPTSAAPRTTGTPEMPCSAVSATSSRTVASGRMTMGSRMTPLSNFFTARTCRACASSGMFLWTTPSPPSCAKAMARPASVTVSMAAAMSGMFRSMPRVRRVRTSTSEGRTSE